MWPWMACVRAFWDWRLATCSTEACPIAWRCVRRAAAPAVAAASHVAAVTRDDAFLLLARVLLGAAFLSFMATILPATRRPCCGRIAVRPGPPASRCFVAGRHALLERSRRRRVLLAAMNEAGQLLRDTGRGAGRAAWRVAAARGAVALSLHLGPIGGGAPGGYSDETGRRTRMNNIFYIIGVVVVILIILGYFGLR